MLNEIFRSAIRDLILKYRFKYQDSNTALGHEIGIRIQNEFYLLPEEMEFVYEDIVRRLNFNSEEADISVEDIRAKY